MVRIAAVPSSSSSSSSSTSSIRRLWLPFLTVLSWLSLFPSSTSACTCLPFDSFENQFETAANVDTVYLFGKIKVTPQGKFNGWVQPNDPDPIDINADIHYLVYQYQSHKSCYGKKGQYLIYSTGGNSALCGVTNLQPGWYVLGSSCDYGNPQFKRMSSCGLIRPWQEYTWEEYHLVQTQTQQAQCHLPQNQKEKCEMPNPSGGGGGGGGFLPPPGGNDEGEDRPEEEEEEEDLHQEEDEPKEENQQDEQDGPVGEEGDGDD